MLYKTYYQSPVGKLFIASNEEDLIGLCIEGQKYYLDKIEKEATLKNDVAIFEKTKDWLDRYFKKERQRFIDFTKYFFSI